VNEYGSRTILCYVLLTGSAEVIADVEEVVDVDLQQGLAWITCI